MALSTIRTYLAVVKHAQIIKGLPEPRESVVSPSVASGPERSLESSGRIRADTAPPPTDNALALTPDAAPIDGSARGCQLR